MESSIEVEMFDPWKEKVVKNKEKAKQKHLDINISSSKIEAVYFSCLDPAFSWAKPSRAELSQASGSHNH